MERPGWVLIANDERGAGCGCSLIGVGVVLLGAGLALEPWRVFVLGAASLAIVAGLAALALERIRSRRWDGFALSADGVAAASARGDQVAIGPLEPAREGDPRIVLRLDVTPDAQALTLSSAAYYVGETMIRQARGGAYRMGPIDGALRELPRRLPDVSVIADALREHRPDIPVSVDVN